MEVITHFRVTRVPSTAPHQLSAVCRRVSMWGWSTLIHHPRASRHDSAGFCRTSINYLNLFSGGKERFLLRAMTDDADEIKFDQRRDAHMLLSLTRIVCYPELQTSPVKDASASILLPSRDSDSGPVFRVLPPSGRRSSTILSCAAILQSSIWLWASSSFRTRTGPSSGPGCWKSSGNARTATIGDSRKRWEKMASKH